MPTRHQSEPALTAVDVLLEPDDTMIARAAAVNERLRSGYPQGFSLDSAHRPHVTMLQRYFPSARLDEAYAAVKNILDGERVASWTLTGVRHYYLPWHDLGLAGIVIAPTPELSELQRRLLVATASFSAGTGTVGAYATTPDDPEINQATLDYVGAFEQVATGSRFNPHVSTGIGQRDDLDMMLAEPFDEFTFTVTSAAAYQLGNFGTASKLLQRWGLRD